MQAFVRSRRSLLLVAAALAIVAAPLAGSSASPAQTPAAGASSERGSTPAPAPFGSASTVIGSPYADIELTPFEPPRKGTVELRAVVRPRPGIHIYAPAQRGYYPVSVTFPTGSGITPVRLDLPAAEPYVFAPTGEKFLVYRAPFTMTQRVRVTARPSPGGAARLAGTLHYQACDEQVCYRPQAVQLEWTRRDGVQP